MAVMESFVRCGSESRLRCPCCQNVVSTSHMDFTVILSVFPDYTERKCRFCRTYSKKKFYIYYIQHVADSNRHHLWSSSSLQLVIRRTRLSTVGDHGFPVAGSRLWNSLPPDVTSVPTLTVFRNRLKTLHILHSARR